MVLAERKTKFRARKLDYSKALLVLRYDQATDLDDYGSPLRTVTQVATGVDKDEEDETHLKAALSAAVSQSQTYYIPTPDAHPAPVDHEELYPRAFKQGKQFIKWPGKTLEDLFADMARYDADPEDAAFAKNEAVDLDIFEWIIDCFEECAHKLSSNAVSLDILERLRADPKKAPKVPDDKVCEKILQYWLRKRDATGRPLVPVLRHEDLSVKIGADPYVCFRRREIKAPRKTRRTDAQCMDKLKRLHYDLATSKALIEAMLKRDRYKRECLLLETSLFEDYWAIEGWKRLRQARQSSTEQEAEWKLPEIPPFRIAAQSVLEPKKKRPKPSSIPDTSAVPDAASQPRTQPTAAASSHSVLKSSKYYKPYYSIEVLRQIQKDMEVLLVDETSRLRDLTGMLDDDLEGEDDASLVDMRKRPDLTGGLPCFARFRLGRSGMVQLDRRPIRDESESRPRLVYNAASRTKLLNARDCSHLHNVFVGNYNQHYIQTTNHISQPLSYSAWVAATAPIVQSALAKTRANGGGGGGGVASSPKKATGPGNAGTNKKFGNAEGEQHNPSSADGSSEPSRGEEHNASSLGSFSSSQPSMTTGNADNVSAASGLAGLANNSQFTIKVKPKPALSN